MSAPRKEKICSLEGCGRKNYARGLCFNDYRRQLKLEKIEAQNKADILAADTDSIGDASSPVGAIDVDDADRLVEGFTAEGFEDLLQSDTAPAVGGHPLLNLWEKHPTTTAWQRRRIIRKMLLNGMEEREIIFRFNHTPTLFTRFVGQIRDPMEMFKRDFVIVKNEISQPQVIPIDAQTQYLDGLLTDIRFAEADRRDMRLSPSDRAKAARSLETLRRTLALMRKAVVAERGRGLVPSRRRFADTDPDDDDEDDEERESSYQIPHVRRPEDRATDDTWQEPSWEDGEESK